MISTGSPINRGGAVDFQIKLDFKLYGTSPVIIELSIVSIDNIYVTWCNILRTVL